MSDECLNDYDESSEFDEVVCEPYAWKPKRFKLSKPVTTNASTEPVTHITFGREPTAGDLQILGRAKKGNIVRGLQLMAAELAGVGIRVIEKIPPRDWSRIQEFLQDFLGLSEDE